MQKDNTIEIKIINMERLIVTKKYPKKSQISHPLLRMTKTKTIQSIIYFLLSSSLLQKFPQTTKCRYICVHCVDVE